MRSFLLHIICIVALFSSCDWVNDDLSDCPTGTWLKISYTYNILNVDAASTQVGDITILAFDKNDKYVDRSETQYCHDLCRLNERRTVGTVRSG